VVSDKKDSSRKKIMIGLAIGVILVCLLAVVIFFMTHEGISSDKDHILKLKLTGNGTIQDSQVSSAKSVLQNRFSERGYDTSVDTMRDDQGNAYLLVYYGNISDGDVTSIATTPGVFEMRIHTSDSQSEHVLYGDDIQSASAPISYPIGNTSASWGIALSLTSSGAQKFQQACIDSGAVKDPDNHSVMMLLDGKMFSDYPLSSDLADSIAKNPVEVLSAMTGTGDQVKSMAENLSMCLQGRTLPVRLEVVSLSIESR
jgi:preprotein translocase subunit SecD